MVPCRPLLAMVGAGDAERISEGVKERCLGSRSKGKGSNDRLQNEDIGRG